MFHVPGRISVQGGTPRCPAGLQEFQSHKGFHENHLISYGNLERIAMGNISMSLHPSDDGTCNSDDDAVTYPALCLNINSDADFTQDKCEDYDGKWLAGATVPEHRRD